MLVSDNKVSEIFKRPKYSQHSKAMRVSLNYPDVIKKALEMAEKVQAVTKELEPEDPIEDLVVDQ